MRNLALYGVLAAACAAAGAEALDLDRAPLWNQKPYTPADGTVVTRNPPPFIWVPPRRALTYVLEIARDAAFQKDAQRYDNVPFSTYALREPLPPGAWHWRYGVAADGGTVYSKARRFTVPADARLMPYPDLAAAAQRAPQAHPRLFVRPEQVAQYRCRAAEGDLKGYCDELKRACDKHLGEELVPEPPYVRAKSSHERGEQHAKIIRETRPPMDWMETTALTYLLTGDAKYGEEAARRIRYFFLEWDPEGPSSYRSYDEPAMWVMMRGVRAYDWTYDLFTPSERTRIEACMRIRARQFYEHLFEHRRFHTNPYESHAGRTLGFLGEASIAFIHEWPEAPEWLNYVLTLFWNIYPAWGEEDGGWHEGPSYWNAYMSFALHFVTPLRVAMDIDLMQKPFFHNTPYYLLYTNPPYAQISPFGDGEDGPAGARRARVMYAFASLLQDPHLMWYPRACNEPHAGGILGAVLKDDALEAQPPADLPQARYFPGVGLASLHTALGDAAEDVHFLLHSDPYGPISHAHADQNAFTLEAFGQPLAICSGFYPWYGSNHHNHWQWESKSSNTITFDGGIGQKKRNHKSKGFITAFEHGQDFDYVCGDATQAYQGLLSRFVRHVVHVRPGVFVMMDELEAPEPRRFEWRLHARSEMDVDEAAQRVTSKQGDARLRVQFLNASPLALSQTTGFEYPPERGGEDQFHFIASPAEKTVAMRYLTVLMPYKAGEQGAVPELRRVAVEGAEGVVVEQDGETCYVAFKTAPEGRYQFGPVATDAAVCAVRVGAGGKAGPVFAHEAALLELPGAGQ